jgi:hypothetical protein
MLSTPSQRDSFVSQQAWEGSSGIRNLLDWLESWDGLLVLFVYFCVTLKILKGLGV